MRLQMEGRVRELALFNLGIDSKLRGCDLVALKVRDICHGDQVAARAIVMQHKTQRPVQFEITPATRDAVQAWIKLAELKSDEVEEAEWICNAYAEQGSTLLKQTYKKLRGRHRAPSGTDKSAE